MNNYTTALTIFNFEGQAFQTTIIDGELWWVVADVCKTLGIANVSQSVENLDNDEKLLYVLHIAGQQRQVWMVNQFGLFALIFRSRKPEAKTFSRWVRHEVLPSIFATGSYNLDAQMGTQEERIARLEATVQTLLETQTRQLTHTNHIPSNELDRHILYQFNRLKKPLTIAQLCGSYLKSYDKCTTRVRCEDLVERGILRKRRTAHAITGIYEII